MLSLPRIAAATWLLHLTSFVLGAPSSSNGEEPRLGAVSSENSVCSQIGIDLLKAGGNAADAMVGTVFCVGVVAMVHSGIGGGGFMLVRSPNGTYEYIDFRETAPAAAFEDMYTNNTAASLYGGLASGVPGELRGLEYLHKHYGVLPWKQVMAPAIKVARFGFTVNADQVRYMTSLSDPSFLTDDPNWAIDFAPHGYRVQLNETMTRKRYADTLEVISNEGADAFYTGAIANATIAALQASNGTMTLDDLKNYTIALRTPSNITYRGYKLTSCGAPAGGSVALSALNIVEQYSGFADPSAINLTTHRLDEAIRFAYGQRTELGDPSFIDGVFEYQDSMLSSATAIEIRSKISDYTTQNVSYYNPGGLESIDTPGTSYIGTADKSGLAISLTTTINTIFGSRLMVPETGIIMNNEMNDFSIPGSSNAFGYIPSPANYVRPGKRPLSSISPTIAETADGKLYLVVGSAGGSRIITATIQNIHHVLDQNMTTPQALAQPRLHDQLSPNLVTFEYPYDNSTVAYMKSLGHNVSWVGPGQSTAQALRLLSNGTFEAAGEPRQVASGGLAV
ncbi:gamma-glutamyltransferase [Pseudomassariella vexata]|uniref:Glutathione hydrolase n=1 Tax=Pseudomassariella vexata TaxID=1141098 RepID=A0A1Y2EFN3_9PEZI|nr:gamma-glutamyltransferase [Pseudomassariella vexata]ORY70380.1 gamma-glutamyltransferase [Pseudomassariella vexata]